MKEDQISNLIKIRLMGAELFRADGQTDVTKPIVTFLNFTDARKKSVKKILYL